jgi:hypothetical protein
VTRSVLILGGDLAGLLTAYRLLPYGFRLTILDRESPPVGAPPPDTPFPFGFGFQTATWNLLQELDDLHVAPPFETAVIEMVGANGKKIPLPQLTAFCRYHLVPDILAFPGLPWPDRLRLLNFLEKQWETQPGTATIADTETVEQWVMQARQSAMAQHYFWNPLCRFLLHAEPSQASLKPFLEILLRYARSPSADTNLYVGVPTFWDQLKIRLRDVLTAKGVAVHRIHDFPCFQFPPSSTDILHLPGRPFLKADAYIATLPPREIQPLLPERALTKYPQLSRLANIPRHTCALLELTVPHLGIPPAIILNPSGIQWVAIQPSTPALSTPTTVQALWQHPPAFSEGTDFPALMDDSWKSIRTLLGLPSDLSWDACSPQITPHAITVYPSLAGTRAFRPAPASPLSNLFFAGPWIDVPFPHSFESLIRSINSCVQSLTNRLLTRFH